MTADSLRPTRHRLTPRSLIAGALLAALLCAINSFLTLRFGIIEEGPMIAALFYYSLFYFIGLLARALARMTQGIAAIFPGVRISTLSVAPITTAELVIVATMGSAGGSLGFIANFFAAKAMTSEPYTVLEMFLFAIVSGIIGILSVLILRHILIIKDSEQPEDRRLSWVGAKVVKGVIDSLDNPGRTIQPRILAIFTLAAGLYVVLNTSGVGWFPEEIPISVFGLSAFGAGLSLAPFAIGSGYIMGLRTCVGFFCGGTALLLMAPHLPTDIQARPQAFLWPGVMFLVASGIAALAMRWRVIFESVKSLFRWSADGAGDDDPVLRKGAALPISLAGLITTVVILSVSFRMSLLVIFAMIVLGGLLLNLIATRAYAQTYFNPVRVMGILLQGVSALLGGSSVGTNLTGAGFIAGSLTQSSSLTSDMVYGRDFQVPSRWQFWAQAAMLALCSLVCALTFSFIQARTPLTFDSQVFNAPVAKMWAVVGFLFDPLTQQGLPRFAVESMGIAGVVGILWAVLESHPRFGKLMPSSIGFGLGLVLRPFTGFSFFAGGVLMWIILGRFFKISKVTLGTIAVGCIVGEGIGGLLQGIFRALNVIGGG
jgi:hypothetical protein